MIMTGILYALLSAALFGVSAPLAKLLLGEVSPWLLAGLLYLGSGIGLGLVRLVRRSNEPGLSRRDLPWFGAAVLGKRPDGTISPFVVVLLLPYFLLAWFAWTLHGWIARPERSHEIVPGLWVGRRARAVDLPEGIACVVDMTSEFWEPAAVRAGRTYLCLPTLDHHVPSDQAFTQLVRRVAELDQPVYVHCAHGYGRAAMLAAAVMIHRGLASDLEDAEQILRQSRPKIHLARRQRELIRRVTRGRPQL